ncbi:S8 family serine peptidase [Schaalia sp. lx-100]|uniref:S8 family serine peptidase n=1 Tax=Schaalia sp. lx-100 TaxID=2899081 RepID=UPI001E2E24C6|nr:S8 family serine peptidase [Schaalia sp. lx-100]MCD4557741.1 S8 family serine peptidase [Schaalia sp. lx-100]
MHQTHARGPEKPLPPPLPDQQHRRGNSGSRYSRPRANTIIISSLLTVGLALPALSGLNGLVSATQHAPHTADAQAVPASIQQEPGTSRVIARFAPEDRESVKTAIEALDGARIIYEYDLVFTGLSLDIPTDKIEALTQIPQITAVEDAPISRAQSVSASQLRAALPASNNFSADGRGMVIATIDSGVDIRHHDLRLDEGFTPKITEITATQPSDDQFTLKVPHGYNYIDNNHVLKDDVPGEQHGMHIAGILAANATDEAIAKGEGIDGVAPNAQLLAYKVFSGTSRAVREDAAYMAMEDAIKHGADVISLSIGSNGTGRPGDTYHTAVENAKAHGVIVVAAMGNGAASSSSTTFDNIADNAFGQTDTATTVSVAATDNAIGVGAAQTPTLRNKSLSIGGKEYRYLRFGDKRDLPTEATEYEFVNVGFGFEADLQDKDLTGKVAVVKRGGENIVKKITRVSEKKPAGMVFINNISQSSRDTYHVKIPTELEPYDKLTHGWSVALAHDEGDELLTRIAQNPRMTIKKNTNKHIDLDIRPAQEIGPAGFSSWGPTVDLELKPDLIAPGEEIYSLANNDDYSVMTGTSMAAPYIAGASTLLLQKLAGTALPQDINRVDLARILLMNTALPLRDIHADGSNPEYSPRQQGAGLVQVEHALANRVLLTHNDKGAAALKEINEQQRTFTLTVRNFGTQPASYDVTTSRVLTSTTKRVEKEDGTDTKPVVNEIHSTAVPGASATASTTRLTVAPGQTETFEVTLDKGEAHEQFVEGYIYLTSTNDTNASLSLPFFGFAGDWGKEALVDAPMWEKDSKLKLTTLLGNRNLSTPQFKELGRTDFEEGVNPDKIAFTHQRDREGILEVAPRLAVLRDILDYRIDIVNKRDDNVEPIKGLTNAKYMKRLLYGEYSYFDWAKEEAGYPLEQYKWDGKAFNPQTGEYDFVADGQYYYRMKFRNKAEGPWQIIYLPVKFDNQKPTATAKLEETPDGKHRVVISSKDNFSLKSVKATLDGEPLKVSKVSERVEADGTAEEFVIDDITFNPLTNNELRVHVIDIAGNDNEDINGKPLVQSLHNPDVSISGISELTKKNVTELRGTVSEQVQALTFQINGQDVNAAIDPQDRTFLADLSNDLIEGDNTLVVKVSFTDGRSQEFTHEFVRDFTAPTVDWDVTWADEDEEYVKVENDGTAQISGTNVHDNVSAASDITVRYCTSDEYPRKVSDCPIASLVDGAFHVSVRAKDYPDGIYFVVSDEAERQTVRYYEFEERDDTAEEDTSSQPSVPSAPSAPSVPLSVQLFDYQVFNSESAAHASQSRAFLPNYFGPGKHAIQFEVVAPGTGWKISLNDGKLEPLAQRGSNFPIAPISEGYSGFNVKIYNSEGTLVFNRGYSAYVDMKEPTTDVFDSLDTTNEGADDSRDIVGTIYANKAGKIRLRGKVSDAGTGWSFYVNGNAVLSRSLDGEIGKNESSVDHTVTLSEGSYLNVKVADISGNSNEEHGENYIVAYDKEDPQVAVENLDENQAYPAGHIPAFRVTDNREVGLVEAYLDGKPLPLSRADDDAALFRAEQPLNEIGHHALMLRALDKAGNEVMVRRSFTIGDLPVAQNLDEAIAQHLKIESEVTKAENDIAEARALVEDLEAQIAADEMDHDHRLKALNDRDEAVRALAALENAHAKLLKDQENAAARVEELRAAKARAGYLYTLIDGKVADVTFQSDMTGYVFHAVPHEDSEIVQALRDRHGDVIVALYDLYLTKDGQRVSAEGTRTVTLPVQGLTNPRIFSIGQDKKAYPVEATVADGRISFDTEHFSIWALVSDPENPDPLVNAKAQALTELANVAEGAKTQLGMNSDLTESEKAAAIAAVEEAARVAAAKISAAHSIEDVTAELNAGKAAIEQILAHPHTPSGDVSVPEGSPQQPPAGQDPSDEQGTPLPQQSGLEQPMNPQTYVGKGRQLATTGAQVLPLALASVLVMGIGGVLALRRREQ